MVTFCRAPVAEVVAELVSPEVPAGPNPRHCRPGAGGRPLAEYNSGSGGKNLKILLYKYWHPRLTWNHIPGS